MDLLRCIRHEAGRPALSAPDNGRVGLVGEWSAARGTVRIQPATEMRDGLASYFAGAKTEVEAWATQTSLFSGAPACWDTSCSRFCVSDSQVLLRPLAPALRVSLSIACPCCRAP